MASLRADETHLDEVEDFLESRTQYKHLKARRRGDAIIIESGAKADPSTHARLRRISAQRWSLEMADHRGRRASRGRPANGGGELVTAMQQDLQSCDTCGLLSRPAPGKDEGRCPRCDEELVFRKPASLQRTDELVKQVEKYLQAQPAVEDVVAVCGMDMLGGMARNSNAATFFINLKPQSQRRRGARQGSQTRGDHRADADGGGGRENHPGRCRPRR